MRHPTTADPPAQRLLVSVEDEVPDRDAVLGEPCTHLAPVVLNQNGHGHDERAAGEAEDVAGRPDHERAPR